MLPFTYTHTLRSPISYCDVPNPAKHRKTPEPLGLKSPFLSTSSDDTAARDLQQQHSMFTLLQSNNRDPKDINFLPTSPDVSHALLQQTGGF